MASYVFKTKPRIYQNKALRFLIKRNGVGMLFMDPGTGKSKVVTDFIAIQTHKYGQFKVLITAPLSALDTWSDQIEEHLGYIKKEDELEEIPTRIFILNSGTILKKAKLISELDHAFEGLTVVVINQDAFKYKHKVRGLKTVTVQDRIIEAVTKHWSPDLIVVDEIHRIKTFNSNVSKAHKKLGAHAHMRIGLTGTAAPHSPLDFYGEYQFTEPVLFGDSWQSFRYYYAIYGGWEGKQVIGFHADRLKELKQKIKSTAFIIRKHEALDLPKVTDIIVPVTLTSELRYYKDMGKELMTELPSGHLSVSPNALTKILRLRQITGGSLGFREPLFDDKGNPVLDKYGIQKEVSRNEDIGNSKLLTLLDKMETIHYAREKQIVFAHFRRDVARIVEACEKQFPKTNIYEITGATKSSHRVRQRKEFARDVGPSIFIAQMRTVSLAINEFVVASYGHFFSLSQLRDDYIQARDRLDRQGQTKPITFYHYSVPHSIDAVILQSHKEKGKLEAAVTKRAREILTLEA